MEVVSMEVSTFEAMIAGFESSAHRVETLCRQHGEKRLQEWLDNQDVCVEFWVYQNVPYKPTGITERWRSPKSGTRCITGERM